MSSPIKKILIFDRVWKIIIFLFISAVIVGSAQFSIIYALINFSNILKIPIIIISVIALFLYTLIYFRLYKKKGKIITAILAILLCLLLAIPNSISFLTMYGKNAMLENNSIHTIPPDVDAFIDENGIVSYNGKNYIYNENITTILFMGIDKTNIDKTYKNGKNGQADAIYAVTIDTSNGDTTVIGISRDTMTDIKIYSGEGNYIRTEKRQLCLAYAYGDGKDMSCESTIWSVSNVLCGVPINTYMAVDLNAVRVLNDAVGGVAVPAYNSSMTKKTGKMITLRGNDVYKYIRSRNINKTESNAHRMTRQIDYLKAFSSKAIERTKKDISTPVNLYNKVNKYSVSTLSVDKITFLTSVFLDGNMNIEFKNIEGEIGVEGNYAAFYPDNQKLYELVLDVFYKEI